MSAVIGIELDPDSLVLTRRRDFKWTFENLDEKDSPIPFPPGELFFEIDTGNRHNARQRLEVIGATGGTYRLGLFGQLTGPIDYNDIAQNPQGLPGDITDALEAVPAIGPGNVRVTPGLYYPSWFLNFHLHPNQTVDEQFINLVNKYTNDFFNLFDELFGVDIQTTVTTALDIELHVRSLKSYDEIGILSFLLNVTSSALRDFFNAVSDYVFNALDTIHVDFFWHRVFDIEFMGALAGRTIPPLEVVTSSLTGKRTEVRITVLEDGEDRFTVWPFEIDDTIANLKVESEDVDRIPDRSRWQLVFLDEGELAGGFPVARGTVRVQE